MARSFTCLVLACAAALYGCSGSEETSSGQPAADGGGGTAADEAPGEASADHAVDHAVDHVTEVSADAPGKDAGTGKDTGPGSCPNNDNGKYCGSDKVGGDPNTLYQCTNGVLSVAEVCANGCVTEVQGKDDRCESPQPAGCNDTAKAALKWEADQLACCAVTWEYWCLKFVYDAFDNAGQPIPLIAADTAAHALAKVKAAGKLTENEDPPCGAILFWDATGPNGGDGHVVIANGDGTVSTSGWSSWSGGTNAKIDWLDTMEGAKAAGWFLP